MGPGAEDLGGGNHAYAKLFQQSRCDAGDDCLQFRLELCRLLAERKYSPRGAAKGHDRGAVLGVLGANYLKYWFDEGTGAVFCLVDAPTKEAAVAVHQEAHGLLADDITEVQEGA
jgi:hypothetical protein